MSASTIDTIALSTGVRLPYVEQRGPDGVPVILHGYGDSWRSWELLPEPPHTIHAFALDQRGHGDADRRRAATASTTTWRTSRPLWTPSGSTRR